MLAAHCAPLLLQLVVVIFCFLPTCLLFPAFVFCYAQAPLFELLGLPCTHTSIHVALVYTTLWLTLCNCVFTVNCKKPISVCLAWLWCWCWCCDGAAFSSTVLMLVPVPVLLRVLRSFMLSGALLMAHVECSSMVLSSVCLVSVLLSRHPAEGLHLALRQVWVPCLRHSIFRRVPFTAR